MELLVTGGAKQADVAGREPRLVDRPQGRLATDRQELRARVRAAIGQGGAHASPRIMPCQYRTGRP